MDEKKFLADQFETNRTHLKAVAYRMLGSRTEADDAVQEAWLRLSRSDAGEVANIGGWLRTVVARICLDTTFMSSIFCKLIRKISRKQFVRCDP